MDFQRAFRREGRTEASVPQNPPIAACLCLNMIPVPSAPALSAVLGSYSLLLWQYVPNMCSSTSSLGSCSPHLGHPWRWQSHPDAEIQRTAGNVGRKGMPAHGEGALTDMASAQMSQVVSPAQMCWGHQDFSITSVWLPLLLSFPLPFLQQFFTLTSHCEALPSLFADCGILTLSSLFSLASPSSLRFLISLPVLLHFLKLLISRLSLSFVFGRGFFPLTSL